ncbi:mannose-1-phosphate guanylyltransferase [Cyanobacterium aponinum UTEX 3221]|uniref:mannose-1-phosphate guanylyltransferase n=1 Tax=Cyanobacterium aponinum TaxID=379064 RepID=UPI002B4BDD9C|nr:mannose-1-phosphate guanylyltransferase [Cyanobacterium aponinum]WRL38212.1 mannose-1-phosphate guanylyltransferase [Cyanobacterium aponinum UTEX 3221]
MRNNKFIPVILAGGKGERFWPLSRLQRPKQFLCLDNSGESLLQTTANRLLNLAGGWQNLLVITSELLADGVKQQLPSLPPDNILVEPTAKDTAPAVTWASLEVKRRYGEDAITAFFPADHYIGNQEQFEKIIETGIKYAQEKQGIITLGIKPDYPSTGYGYIEQGEKQGENDGISFYRVTRFTEKPDEKTAKEFIATQKYSWNSGMFIFPVGVVLEELQKHAPQILQPLQEKGKSAYTQLEKISIDYALMEKTDLAYMIWAEFGWDDLGDWNALERLLAKENNNILVGDSFNQDSENNIIYNNQSDEIVMTIGVEDLVIVREGNATLIAHKNKTQDIKKALKLLQQRENKDNFL